MTSEQAPKKYFTAVIRWRGPEPTIEIETRHAGFSCPEEAALFANAVAPDSPLGLRVGAAGSLDLLSADGRYAPLIGAEVTVWKLPPAVLDSSDFVVARDEDFEPHALPGLVLPVTAYGDYEQAQYAVLDASGSPLDVQVEWDEADHLRVTVAQPGDTPVPDLTFAVGALPEA